MRIILIFIFLLPLCYAFDFNVGDEIYSGEEFLVEAISNDSNIYDVKIDIFGDDRRISRIYYNDKWKSTAYYLNNALKSTGKFKLKTENFVGNAIAIFKVRDDSDKIIFTKNRNISIKNRTAKKNGEDEEVGNIQEKEKNGNTKSKKTEKDLSFLNKNISKSNMDSNLVANKVINLNPQSIKMKESNSIINKGYIKYSFFIFSAIVVLLFFKKEKEIKNEFR
jgi:hypothetical protein